MDAIEKRARELLAVEHAERGFKGHAKRLREGHGPVSNPDGMALNAIIAALTPPEGYVLVPVEPTDDMLLAAYRADTTKGPVTRRWFAMLAARPEVKP